MTFDPALKSIHDVIRDECENEGMILTYGGKPHGNIFRHKKDGTSYITGYLYRGKTEIYDRDMAKAQMGLFDVWAEIHEIVNFEFEELN